MHSYGHTFAFFINTCISNGARYSYKKKNFEVGVFKQDDVLKQMFQKGYKISFRMYLNLCNANFQELMWKREFIRKFIHFSIASFNMKMSMNKMANC